MSVSKKSISEPPATVQNFPIVGIGASAGGLIAFKQLLQAIPEISGMAYVLVQHLDPNHDSILPEILQKVTKIPVHEITDEIHLAPDHIYIIPENKMLTSTDGILQLSPRNKKTLKSIYDGFKTNQPMDLPIIIESEGGYKRVFSGNTRMDIAFQLGINPKVLLIKGNL
jgi:two-component system CheB/CheR fusion protein